MPKDHNYLGQLIPQKPIRVYGAGIAGLVTAYYAQKAGYQVELHEKSSQAGGLIQIEKVKEGFLDTAAHTILITKPVENLLKELQLTPELFPEKTSRYLVKSGQDFQSFPISLSDFPKLLAKGMKKIPQSSLAAKASVADFFTPWIGEKLMIEVLSTALQGIYSSDAKELHFQSIFPPAHKGQRYLHWAKETIKNLKKEKKVSASFPKGMGELTEKLANYLKKVTYYNSSPPLDNSYNNIICTNAHDAASFIPSCQKELEAIDYKKLSKITCFSKDPISKLDGSFGVLFSSHSDFKTMGIINTSHLFPKRTLHKNLYQYSFLCQSPTDYHHDLKLLKINSIQNEKTFTYKKAIPVYNFKRFQKIQKIKQQLNQEAGLILFGNYTGSISLRKIITDAQNFFA